MNKANKSKNVSRDSEKKKYEAFCSEAYTQYLSVADEAPDEEFHSKDENQSESSNGMPVF